MFNQPINSNRLNLFTSNFNSANNEYILPNDLTVSSIQASTIQVEQLSADNANLSALNGYAIAAGPINNNAVFTNVNGVLTWTSLPGGGNVSYNPGSNIIPCEGLANMSDATPTDLVVKLNNGKKLKLTGTGNGGLETPSMNFPTLTFNTQLVGNATADRSLILPDASGTLGIANNQSLNTGDSVQFANVYSPIGSVSAWNHNAIKAGNAFGSFVFQGQNFLTVLSLNSEPTDNREIYLPNASGILALEGANPFNQSLNTGDNVTFSGLTCAGLRVLPNEAIGFVSGSFFGSVQCTTLTNFRSWTLPDVSGSVAIGDQTVNQSSTPTFAGAFFNGNIQLTAAGSITTQLGSGMTIFPANTTLPRIISIPDASGTLAIAGDQKEIVYNVNQSTVGTDLNGSTISFALPYFATSGLQIIVGWSGVADIGVYMNVVNMNYNSGSPLVVQTYTATVAGSNPNCQVILCPWAVTTMQLPGNTPLQVQLRLITAAVTDFTWYSYRVL